MLQTLRHVEERGWKSQLAAGVDRIGVGDATLYDRVLDWVIRLGLIPARFAELRGLERYFAMARGAPGKPALELTKWFDTNYHYLVPELEGACWPGADFVNFLETVKRARRLLGERAVPIILGPVTLLQLSRSGDERDGILRRLVPLYQSLLADLKSLGATEIQVHEPALVLGEAVRWKRDSQAVYSGLAEVDLPINLVTYFDDLGDTYTWVVDLPVSTLGLDFTRGQNLQLVKAYGWPENKTLGAGVVDGRNIWRIRPEEILQQVKELDSLAPLRVGPSCSLQFVPLEAARETTLPAHLRGVLAFAEEKLQELGLLARSLGQNGEASELAKKEAAWQRFEDFALSDVELMDKLSRISEEDFKRATSYEERRPQ